MVRRFMSKHPLVVLVASYLLLALAVSLVLFWRFPNNVTHANFYAEDGSVFLQNVLDKGWIHATLTPFNGYSVIGLYLLEAKGWILNSIFGSGLLTLPAYFALVSIVFMGSVIALPYLLFSRAFGKLKMLMVVVFGALVPLPTSPHIVIGNIGNQKWMFFYLALLVVIYQLLNYKKLSLVKLIAIDAVLLICAYTNSTTYTLIPLLLIPCAMGAWNHRKSLVQWAKRQLRLKECWSLIILCLLLLPQIIYVGLHGIPAQPGYLDSAYQASRTIEVFINRTFLFGSTHIVNGYMNDVFALVFFAALVFIGWKLLRGKEKLVFFASLYAAAMASILFVFNRHGVTDFFFGYQPSGSGPDQFFYVQTLIMYLPIVLAAFAVSRLFKNEKLGYGLLALFSGLIIISGLVSNAVYGARWRNASVFENSTNTFIDQSLITCAQEHGNKVRVAVYPYSDGRFALSVDDDKVCNKELNKYQPSYQSFKLEPNNNDYNGIDKKADFYQTFKAQRNNLDGIRLFVSTFNNARRQGVYELTIYDQSCRKVLRTASIPTLLMDNSFYNARFKPIEDSAGKTLCFGLTPPDGAGYSPIAVQRSRPLVYLDGELKEGGRTLQSDVVFQLLYTQINEQKTNKKARKDSF